MNSEEKAFDLIAIAKIQGLTTLTEEESDRLSVWLEAYFALGVTTSVLSRREQRRDLERFIAFLRRETGSDHRAAWTPPLSRAFVEALRSEVKEAGGRRFSDRTINRTLAHLKTFATWIHKHCPFTFGNPTEKLKNLIVAVGLEIERALTEEERAQDAEVHTSPALFLPAATVTNSPTGRLAPTVINTIWNEVCKLANLKGKTPHSARHAMGRHLMKKTGNAAAVQRQLGHSHVAFSLQYARITDEELQRLLDERSE